MNLLQWLHSLRRPNRPTAADIRGRLNALRRRHDEVLAERNALALDAVLEERAAEKWAELDDLARGLVRQIDVLAAALPQAEAHETEAARQAEAVRRERAVAAYQLLMQEAQQTVAAVVTTLPNGETLTALRDLRDRLAREARDIRTWSNDPDARRPPDPLSEVVGEMQNRIDRVGRARWAPSHPITLGRRRTDAVAEAVARIERMAQ